jgi:hypothetical protein
LEERALSRPSWDDTEVIPPTPIRLRPRSAYRLLAR